MDRLSKSLLSSFIFYQNCPMRFHFQRLSIETGVGKSIQTALWEKYRKSVIVSGDRTLLRRNEGQWLSCVRSVCGPLQTCRWIDVPARCHALLGKEKRRSVFDVNRGLSTVLSLGDSRSMESGICPDCNITGIEAPGLQPTCDISEETMQCQENVLLPDRL